MSPPAHRSLCPRRRRLRRRGDGSAGTFAGLLTLLGVTGGPAPCLERPGDDGACLTAPAEAPLATAGATGPALGITPQLVFDQPLTKRGCRNPGGGKLGEVACRSIGESNEAPAFTLSADGRLVRDVAERSDDVRLALDFSGKTPVFADDAAPRQTLPKTQPAPKTSPWKIGRMLKAGGLAMVPVLTAQILAAWADEVEDETTLRDNNGMWGRLVEFDSGMIRVDARPHRPNQNQLLGWASVYAFPGEDSWYYDRSGRKVARKTATGEWEVRPSRIGQAPVTVARADLKHWTPQQVEVGGETAVLFRNEESGLLTSKLHFEGASFALTATAAGQDRDGDPLVRWSISDFNAGDIGLPPVEPPQIIQQERWVHFEDGSWEHIVTDEFGQERVLNAFYANGFNRGTVRVVYSEGRGPPRIRSRGGTIKFGGKEYRAEFDGKKLKLFLPNGDRAPDQVLQDPALMNLMVQLQHTDAAFKTVDLIHDGQALASLKDNRWTLHAVEAMQAHEALANHWLLAQILGIACFVEGTLVHTDSGLQPVETLKRGDLVWAQDERTGEQALRPVVATKKTPYQRALRLTLEGPEGAEYLGVTKNHRIYTPDKQWVTAGSLKPNDIVATQSGELLRVTGIEPWGQPVTVYNVEVDGFHTYFVGQHRAWVHNTYEGDGTGGEPDGGIGALLSRLEAIPRPAGVKETMRQTPGGMLVEWRDANGNLWARWDVTNPLHSFRLVAGTENYGPTAKVQDFVPPGSEFVSGHAVLPRYNFVGPDGKRYPVVAIVGKLTIMGLNGEAVPRDVVAEFTSMLVPYRPALKAGSIVYQTIDHNAVLFERPPLYHARDTMIPDLGPVSWRGRGIYRSYALQIDGTYYPVAVFERDDGGVELGIYPADGATSGPAPNDRVASWVRGNAEWLSKQRVDSVINLGGPELIVNLSAVGDRNPIMDAQRRHDGDPEKMAADLHRQIFGVPAGAVDGAEAPIASEVLKLPGRGPLLPRPQGDAHITIRGVQLTAGNSFRGRGTDGSEVHPVAITPEGELVLFPRDEQTLDPNGPYAGEFKTWVEKQQRFLQGRDVHTAYVLSDPTTIGLMIDVTEKPTQVSMAGSPAVIEREAELFAGIAPAPRTPLPEIGALIRMVSERTPLGEKRAGEVVVQQLTLDNGQELAVTHIAMALGVHWMKNLPLRPISLPRIAADTDAQTPSQLLRRMAAELKSLGQERLEAGKHFTVKFSEFARDQARLQIKGGGPEYRRQAQILAESASLLGNQGAALIAEAERLREAAEALRAIEEDWGNLERQLRSFEAELSQSGADADNLPGNLQAARDGLAQAVGDLQRRMDAFTRRYGLLPLPPLPDRTLGTLGKPADTEKAAGRASVVPSPTLVAAGASVDDIQAALREFREGLLSRQLAAFNHGIANSAATALSGDPRLREFLTMTKAGAHGDLAAGGIPDAALVGPRDEEARGREGNVRTHQTFQQFAQNVALQALATLPPEAAQRVLDNARYVVESGVQPTGPPGIGALPKPGLDALKAAIEFFELHTMERPANLTGTVTRMTHLWDGDHEGILLGLERTINRLLEAPRPDPEWELYLRLHTTNIRDDGKQKVVVQPYAWSTRQLLWEQDVGPRGLRRWAAHQSQYPDGRVLPMTTAVKLAAELEYMRALADYMGEDRVELLDAFLEANALTGPELDAYESGIPLTRIYGSRASPTDEHGRQFAALADQHFRQLAALPQFADYADVANLYEVRYEPGETNGTGRIVARRK